MAPVLYDLCLQPVSMQFLLVCPMKICGGYATLFVRRYPTVTFCASHMSLGIQLIIFILAGYVSDALGEPNTVSYRTPLDSQYGYVGPAGSAPILVPPETANADNLWSSQVSDTFVAEPEPGYDPYIVGNPSRNFFNPDFGTMDNPDAAGYFNPPPGADDGSFYTHSTIDLYGNSSSNVRRSSKFLLSAVELAC